MTGKLSPSIVEHVPREPRYALQYGAITSAEVKNICPKRSPLVQDGLEISIEMSIMRAGVEKIEKLKIKPGNVKIGNYIDISFEILKEIGVDVKLKTACILCYCSF